MRALGIVAIIVLAGCAGTPDPDRGTMTALEGTVLAAGEPLPGAEVALLGAGRSTTTDAQGAFRFADVPAGRCDLRVSAVGHVAKDVVLTCPSSDLTVVLDPVLKIADEPEPPEPNEEARPQLPLRFRLDGTVYDEVGAPLPGASWRAVRNGSSIASGVADSTGEFGMRLGPGLLELTVSAACRAPTTHALELTQDMAVDIHLTAPEGAGVGAPSVQAVGGPGPGMVTYVWEAVPGATRYEVDDGGLHDLGGALAWSDHTPDQARVRAVDGCGVPGQWSDEASATAAPGTTLPSLAAPTSASPRIEERRYDVLDADGAVVETRSWRVVVGTGNCCENYVATTRDGWVMDFGGSSLLFSKDEGASWQEIVPHGFQVCGEGAVVPGPGGDIYAMNWEMCLGAGDDGIWTLKYVAADDEWIEGTGPVHAPFFDRPWISVFPGPHVDAAGQTSAVRSYIFTNFNDNIYGQGHVVSGDGIAYLPQPPLVDSMTAPTGTLPETLLPDPDADWTQPIVQSFGRALDPGLGVVDVGLTTCQLLDTPEGRECAPYDLPVRSMQRDGGGRLHAVQFGSGSFTYRWSDDVGRNWEEKRFPLPPGVDSILEWDLKAHHGLDRAVVAIHAGAGGEAEDYAIVLREIREEPVIDRVMRVGAGGGTAGSGVGADVRYDFMTAGFLPDGRVALSFTDSEFHPPAVAIEMA